MSINLLMAAVSGIASAILFIGLVSGHSLGFFSFILLALPISIAGLGWSRATAALGVAIAAIVIGAVSGPMGSLIFVAIIGMPLVGVCWLISLHRTFQTPYGQTQTEWYPVGRIVAAISLWAGTLTAILIAGMMQRPEQLKAASRQAVDVLFDQVFKLPPETQAQMTAERRDQMADVLIGYLPFALSTLWMLIAVVSLYLAALIVHRSGALARPWPDLSGFVLPRILNVAFMIAAALTFVGGTIGLMSKAFVWAIAFAYVLQGLAIIHQVSRGSSFRGAILGAIYLALVLIQPLSTMAIALVGLAEPVSPLRRKTTELGPPPPFGGGRSPPPSGPT